MKRLLLTLLVAALTIGVGSAQSRKALKINEVMVVNNTSAIDDYGNHSAWIELYNSNYAPLQIAKVYLTNDPNNPTKYPVPLGDVNTKIPKRQHVLFWADNAPSKGTFHMNFELTPGQDNYIALYDADGKTLIDEVTVPASLKPDQSYARDVDGDGAWSIRANEGSEDYVTPSSANIIVSSNPKVDMFKERDENGLGLTIIAMAIVFCALLLLCICFYIISKIGARALYRKKMQAEGKTDRKLAPAKERRHDSGEEIAAIVMALHEHINVHDQESTRLTLNKIKKAYSPWNSKIYNMRQVPEAPVRRKF